MNSKNYNTEQSKKLFYFQLIKNLIKKVIELDGTIFGEFVRRILDLNAPLGDKPIPEFLDIYIASDKILKEKLKLDWIHKDERLYGVYITRQYGELRFNNKLVIKVRVQTWHNRCADFDVNDVCFNKASPTLAVPMNEYNYKVIEGIKQKDAIPLGAFGVKSTIPVLIRMIKEGWKFSTHINDMDPCLFLIGDTKYTHSDIKSMNDTEVLMLCNKDTLQYVKGEKPETPETFEPVPVDAEPTFETDYDKLFKFELIKEFIAKVIAARGIVVGEFVRKIIDLEESIADKEIPSVLDVFIDPMSQNVDPSVVKEFRENCGVVWSEKQEGYYYGSHRKYYAGILKYGDREIIKVRISEMDQGCMDFDINKVCFNADSPTKLVKFGDFESLTNCDYDIIERIKQKKAIDLYTDPEDLKASVELMRDGWKFYTNLEDTEPCLIQIGSSNADYKTYTQETLMGMPDTEIKALSESWFINYVKLEVQPPQTPNVLIQKTESFSESNGVKYKHTYIVERIN
jgi:hypothetical protein